MLIDNIVLQQVIAHRVGNPTRGEESEISSSTLVIDEDTVARSLVKYFTGNFNENELYQFTHLSDIALNEVYTYARTIFEDNSTFLEQSQLIAQFLHSKSTHVKVKEGEVYIALLHNVAFGENDVQALAICKSENKEAFLKLARQGNDYEMLQEEGININKLDKGCLIFRTETVDGFRACVVDHTNKQQDAQYWLNDFLQLQPMADSYHQTDKYLSLCKNFITKEYSEKFDVSKGDQAEMLNRSIEYFKSNEQFSLQQFTTEVIHHPEVVDTFMDYKKNFENARNFEIEDEFAIHVAAVKKQQRVFKSVVKLDRNFHIYIHGRQDLIEKGVDEKTGRKYYKIFYEEEN